MHPFVTELLKLALIGVIAGVFTSAMSNRDHRRRTWWELRVRAYQSAIESLSDLAYFYSTNFAAEISGMALTDERRQKLTADWADSFDKVRRLADSGAFLFSERANASLRQFVRQASEYHVFEQLDTNIDLAERCLRELVECSKGDLHLGLGILDRFF